LYSPVRYSFIEDESLTKSMSEHMDPDGWGHGDGDPNDPGDTDLDGS